MYKLKEKFTSDELKLIEKSELGFCNPKEIKLIDSIFSKIQQVDENDENRKKREENTKRVIKYLNFMGDKYIDLESINKAILKII